MPPNRIFDCLVQSCATDVRCCTNMTSGEEAVLPDLVRSVVDTMGNSTTPLSQLSDVELAGIVCGCLVLLGGVVAGT